MLRLCVIQYDKDYTLNSERTQQWVGTTNWRCYGVYSTKSIVVLLLWACPTVPTVQALPSQRKKEKVTRARGIQACASGNADTLALVPVAKGGYLVHAKSIEKAGIVEANISFRATFHSKEPAVLIANIRQSSRVGNILPLW
jgi:hypothetical protein